MAKTSRSEIVATAQRLMRDKGYAATSMQDVASAVGILKGSLYSHFANKEALVPEVLELSFAQAFGEVTPSGHWRNDYELALQSLTQMLITNRRCIGMQLAYGLDESNPVLRDAVTRFFDDIHALLSALLQQGIEPDLAESLAMDTLTQLEGATLWLALRDDEKPIQQSMRQLQMRADALALEPPDPHVRRILEQSTDDWRKASTAERRIAEEAALAQSDALNVRAALEAASCFR